MDGEQENLLTINNLEMKHLIYTQKEINIRVFLKKFLELILMNLKLELNLIIGVMSLITHIYFL